MDTAGLLSGSAMRSDPALFGSSTHTPAQSVDAGQVPLRLPLLVSLAMTLAVENIDHTRTKAPMCQIRSEPIQIRQGTL